MSNLLPIGSILQKPTLNLHNGFVDTIKLGGLVRLEEAQTVNVSGNSTIGSIIEGGNRVLPGHLTINLAKDASLFDTNGALLIHSTLVETGSAGSTYYNEGTVETWAGSRLTFGTTVQGIGSFKLDDKPQYGSGSVVEFKGAVGAGQSISIDAGRVQVDKPMQFLATITHLSATPETKPNDLDHGSVILAHTHATMGRYTGSDLILSEKGHVVADIHVKATAASALFVTNEPGGSVAITGFAMPGSAEFHAGSPFIHIA